MALRYGWKQKKKINNEDVGTMAAKSNEKIKTLIICDLLHSTNRNYS